MYHSEHLFIHSIAKFLFFAMIMMPSDTTRRQPMIKQETKIDCTTLESKVKMMNAMIDTMTVQVQENKIKKAKNQ